MPGRDPLQIEGEIRNSEPDGGVYFPIATFGWWNAVDVTADQPVNSNTGEFVSGIGPEVQFFNQAAGGPYGVRWGNSEDGTVGWNFSLPRNYMQATGQTRGIRKQVWVLDCQMQATTTATPVRARLRRNDASAGVTVAASVTADADVTVPITGDGRITFTFTNPAGAPRDNYQLNILPVSALGASDTLKFYYGTLYVKCHLYWANRTTRFNYD